MVKLLCCFGRPYDFSVLTDDQTTVNMDPCIAVRSNINNEVKVKAAVLIAKMSFK